MALATSRSPPVGLVSDDDMDDSVLFARLDGPQPDARVRRVAARLDPELVAVPRTDDAGIRLVELEATRDVVGIEDLDDAGQQRALADGGALMWTTVLV